MTREPGPASLRFEQLLAWHRQALAGDSRLADLAHGYYRFLVQSGVAVCRATLAMETLHPQIQALRYVWYDELRDPGPFPNKAAFHREILQRDGCTIDEAWLSHGARNTPQYLSSPFAQLNSATPSLSFTLTPGESYPYPVLNDLARQGASQYVAFLLPAIDGQLSLVTRAPGGFDAAALAQLEASLPLFCALIGAALKDVILDTVLNCYVGNSPAREIRKGNIRPGRMLELQGAIWFSDIRGYSTHTQHTEGALLIEKLNAYYECVVPIIYEHQGEVLKFIGDAVLAIFTDQAPEDERVACRNALAAAQAATRTLRERDVGFEHGIGLHVGRFGFGNIGSLRRMDFTVIGNEVNVAARIEAQCKAFGARILMSGAFVAESGAAAREQTRVELKGIEGEYALFTPEE